MGRTLRRNFNCAQLGITAANATTGVWTLALSSAGVPSGMFNLHKAAAASTSVVHITIPHGPRGGLPTNEDGQVSVIEVFYLVTTANLTSAPTAVLNKYSSPGGAGTGLGALAAVTQVLTFAGVDTVGTANGAGASGSHIAVITVSTPFTCNDYENLMLQMTMNEAATSVLDLIGVAVTYL